MAELDVERIATAALAVADERGAAGFTMRALADAMRSRGISCLRLWKKSIVCSKRSATAIPTQKSNQLNAPADLRESILPLAKPRQVAFGRPKHSPSGHRRKNTNTYSDF